MDRLWRSNSSISSRTGCPPDIVNDEDHKVESCGTTVPMCLHGTKSKIFKNNFLPLTGSDTIKRERDSALEVEAQLYSDNIT